MSTQFITPDGGGGVGIHNSIMTRAFGTARQHIVLSDPRRAIASISRELAPVEEDR